MGEHSAFHGREDGLQRLVLLNEITFIGAFLGDVDGNAHRAHDRAIRVVQR